MLFIRIKTCILNWSSVGRGETVEFSGNFAIDFSEVRILLKRTSLLEVFGLFFFSCET